MSGYLKDPATNLFTWFLSGFPCYVKSVGDTLSIVSCQVAVFQITALDSYPQVKWMQGYWYDCHLHRWYCL